MKARGKADVAKPRAHKKHAKPQGEAIGEEGDADDERACAVTGGERPTDTLFFHERFYATLVGAGTVDANPKKGGEHEPQSRNAQKTEKVRFFRRLETQKDDAKDDVG